MLADNTYGFVWFCEFCVLVLYGFLLNQSIDVFSNVDLAMDPWRIRGAVGSP